MTIIIDMNIYITPANEEKLRQVKDFTMSGLVNYLLGSYWEGHSIEDVKQIERKTLKSVGFCQHGAAIGMCKFGCKK